MLLYVALLFLLTPLIFQRAFGLQYVGRSLSQIHQQLRQINAKIM